MPSILVVEPDRITAQLIAGLFSGDENGHEAVVAITEAEVRKAVESHSIDLALVRYGPNIGPIVYFLDGLDPRPRILVRGRPQATGPGEDWVDDVDASMGGVASPDELARNVEKFFPE